MEGWMNPAATMDDRQALPNDFHLVPGWLAGREADAIFETLLRETPWEDHEFRMGSRVVPMPRRIAFYGPHPYRYSGLLHPAQPLSPLLERLRVRIEAAAGHPFNTLLLNLYRDRTDSVSWHSDDDYPHGGQPAVASVSLGATRRFHIAHKRKQAERFTLLLSHGDLLVMEGRSQLDYRHSLPKSTTMVGPRINLTFRFMLPSPVSDD
jgi:alkylated DNA repair dioxygenase AlkB